MQKKILFSLLCGLIPSFVVPSWGHYAKSALQIGSGFAMWALPIRWGVLGEIGKGAEDSYEYHQMCKTTKPKASNPLVESFIRESLKSGRYNEGLRPIKDAERIKITMNSSAPDFGMNDFRDGNLIIPYDEKVIEVMIKNKDHEKLALIRSSIAHEVVHFLNSDYTVQEFLNAGMIFGVSSAALLLQKLLYKAPKQPSIPFAITRTCAALPLYLINQRLIALYSQKCEWRADENIPQEEDSLKAQIDYYRNEEGETEKAYQDWNSLGVKNLKKGNLHKGVRQLWYANTSIRRPWFSSHPHPTTRRERFEQRLDELNDEKAVQ